MGAPGVEVAGWDGAVAIWVTEVVRICAGVGLMSLAVAISAVLVLVALGGGVADLVTGTAMCLCLLVVGAIGTNMAHVATHGAEVVHVNDWRGSRVCGRVLQLGGVRGKGERDSGSGGRGVDCRRNIEEVCAN